MPPRAPKGEARHRQASISISAALLARLLAHTVPLALALPLRLSLCGSSSAAGVLLHQRGAQPDGAEMWQQQGTSVPSSGMCDAAETAQGHDAAHACCPVLSPRHGTGGEQAGRLCAAQVSLARGGAAQQRGATSTRLVHACRSPRALEMLAAGDEVVPAAASHHQGRWRLTDDWGRSHSGLEQLLAQQTRPLRRSRGCRQQASPPLPRPLRLELPLDLPHSLHLLFQPVVLGLKQQGPRGVSSHMVRRAHVGGMRLGSAQQRRDARRASLPSMCLLII